MGVNSTELAKMILSDADYQELDDALNLISNKDYNRVYAMYAGILSEFVECVNDYETPK